MQDWCKRAVCGSKVRTNDRRHKGAQANMGLHTRADCHSYALSLAIRASRALRTAARNSANDGSSERVAAFGILLVGYGLRHYNSLPNGWSEQLGCDAVLPEVPDGEAWGRSLSSFRAFSGVREAEQCRALQATQVSAVRPRMTAFT